MEELSKEDVEMKKALGQGLQSPLERRRGQANRDAETGDAMKVRKSGAEVKAEDEQQATGEGGGGTAGCWRFRSNETGWMTVTVMDDHTHGDAHYGRLAAPCLHPRPTQILLAFYL